MKLTLDWLKQHLETEADLVSLTERMTMLGLEVETVTDPSAALQGFTTAHILEATKHPDADKLRVCRVDTGAEIIQVVCGAPNARAGLKVILARPGTRIPATGDVLKKGVIRGVESQGMLCSWRELAMGEDHDGIAELPEQTPVGKALTEILTLDPVIEISLTPNRADCLGIRGIARDLAAAGLGRLKPLDIETIAGSFASPITVQRVQEAETACPLFAGRMIRGIQNRESPQWLKDRLNAIGLRPISALVDITNYLSFDLARPLHVFDADKIHGSLIVRLAQQGEILKALNGKEYVLTSEMTVIADDLGPQALGGVIGGEASSVDENTVSVFVESALFDPVRTAATGRALSIDSDARHRFERFVDPAFCVPGLDLATRMILDLCGTSESTISHVIQQGEVPAWRRSIPLRAERVRALSGIDLSHAEIHSILESLGCVVEAGLIVHPPSWRGDLHEEHDLIEEIIRIHGYDAIPSVTLPRPALPKPVLTPQQRRTGFIRRSLAARGLVEAVTWSFLSSAMAESFGGAKPELTLSNPISADLNVMRPSLLPNLIMAAAKNFDRGLKDACLFEIGPQFDGATPEEQKLVVAALRSGKTGSRHWAEAPRSVDLFDIKADLFAILEICGFSAESFQIVREAPSWYHPGRSGALKQGQKKVAVFGELHPKILANLDMKAPAVGFELFLDALPAPKAKSGKAKPALKLSPFQPLERDFAFILDRSISADQVIRAAKKTNPALISAVTVFDLYEGEHVEAGMKSLAITVTLQPMERTLTDQEIEAISSKIIDEVVKVTGGKLRAS